LSLVVFKRGMTSTCTHLIIMFHFTRGVKNIYTHCSRWAV